MFIVIAIFWLAYYVIKCITQIMCMHITCTLHDCALHVRCMCITSPRFILIPYSLIYTYMLSTSCERSMMLYSNVSELHCQFSCTHKQTVTLAALLKHKSVRKLGQLLHGPDHTDNNYRQVLQPRVIVGSRSLLAGLQCL